MINYIMCNCNSQTFYECGGLGKNHCEYAVVKDTVNVALCESRHEIPEATDGAIYPAEIANPMDFGVLREIARDSLTPAFVDGVKTVNVYVTGLTPALLSVINYCRECNVKCVTYHYDRSSGKYLPLPMV